MAAMCEVTKGNLAAFRYLFDNNFADLCNYLLLYLHNQALAEEIALDIFTYIWEKREFIQLKSSFRGFLFAAARNRAVNEYRKEQKKIISSLNVEDFSFFHSVSSQELLEKEELNQLICNAVERLPEKSRNIYRMAWEDGLPQKEIAVRLGLSAKTVENHVGIALRKLRESLRPYYEQIFLLVLFFLFF